MALSLGNPNLPGNPEFVRKAGRVLLGCLLPYYALGIGNGFFLPQLVSGAWTFAACDIASFVILPGVILFYLYRRFQLSPADYCYIGRGINYRGWELAVITFWWAGFLFVLDLLGEPLITIPLGLILAPLHWVLSHIVAVPDVNLHFPAQFSYGAAMPDNPVLHAVVAIFFAVTAGVFEEIFFRGLFRQTISALLGPTAVKTYVISSAAIFGLAHWEQGSAGLFRATAFGLGAAILYLKLGDLRPLILAHALIDLYIFW